MNVSMVTTTAIMIPTQASVCFFQTSSSYTPPTPDCPHDSASSAPPTSTTTTTTTTTNSNSDAKSPDVGRRGPTPSKQNTHQTNHPKLHLLAHPTPS